MVEGQPIHGLIHPEVGHLLLVRQAEDDAPSTCPFHDNCAEGLASGSAVMRRAGARLDELPVDHPCRALVADYLGQLCANLVLTVSPQCIVIGGGVAQTERLHAAVMTGTRGWLGGYLDHQALRNDDFITPPRFGSHASIYGALAAAKAGCPSQKKD